MSVSIATHAKALNENLIDLLAPHQSILISVKLTQLHACLCFHDCDGHLKSC